MSDTDRAAWLHWARGRAGDALERGRGAEQAGALDEARRWLERARRLAPTDATVAVSLGGLLLRQGDPEAAARLLRPIADVHDLREAWSGVAVCALQQGRVGEAASAVGALLSRHAPDDSVAMLAGLVVERAGLPGWCGVCSDGRLWPAQPQAVKIALDGVALAAGLDALPSGWRAGQTLSVERDGRPLLGSPVDLAAIARVEGVVESRDGGVSGWAWHPADPDRAPDLVVHRADGTSWPLRPTDLSITVEGAAPLSRPRGFAVGAEALRSLVTSGSVRVTDAGGRDLLGSPVDPGLESRVARGAQAQADWSPSWADLAASAAVPGRRARQVDVVVPVYRGRQRTLDCLEGVLATLPAGSRLHVVDDASPDRALVAALAEMARAGRIRLIRQARNTGFPGAANAGLRAAAGRDVVLLNSDTLVPPGWLERLRVAAHSSPDIGTATPLSNDATICSYPSREPVNAVPDAAAVRRLARLAAAANAGAVVDIPTGHGFCLYIRRDCLDDAGALREDLFAQGYGEENEFCLRASRRGWRHVAVPGAYVGHVGGVSFGMGRAHLVRRNLAVLNRLHPGYDALVAAHIAADPLFEVRRRIDVARWKQGRAAGAVLLVTHEGGGGVERVVRERCQSLRTAGLRPIVLRPIVVDPDVPRGGSGACLVSEQAGSDATAPDAFPNLRFRLPGELASLLRLLRGERVLHAELHHLLGHHRAVTELCRRLGVPYDVYVHDYASFCQRIALVGPGRRYCGEPDVAGCDACVADLGSHLEEEIAMPALLARSAAELAGARTVVAPSADAASRLRRHFPEVRATVQPWEDESGLPPMRAPRARATLRVCVVGAIGLEKGYDVLLACARDCAARALPLEFVVVGPSIDDERLMRAGPVFVTGDYRDAEVDALIRAQDCDLGLLPSIWPETWCYTLTHMMRAGLGVAAFDLGAPAERIRRTGRGWLLPLGLPAASVNNALLRLPRVADHNRPSHSPAAGPPGR